MNLPLFRLLHEEREIVQFGTLVFEVTHKHAVDAFQRMYSISPGGVMLTLWRGRLHEVVYQTPADSEFEALERNRLLFSHYGEGFLFDEILDNGFGKSYRRSDLERYALWSYVMDYTTIGTMAFHAVKWGLGGPPNNALQRTGAPW